MTYVDPIKKYNRRGEVIYSCHMIADTIQELHTFAATIQVKKFHKGKILHYDLNRLERTRAIINGAKEVTSRDIVRMNKILSE